MQNVRKSTSQANPVDEGKVDYLQKFSNFSTSATTVHTPCYVLVDVTASLLLCLFNCFTVLDKSFDEKKKKNQNTKSLRESKRLFPVMVE